jgi:hypothetical protein
MLEGPSEDGGSNDGLSKGPRCFVLEPLAIHPTEHLAKVAHGRASATHDIGVRDGQASEDLETQLLQSAACSYTQRQTPTNQSRT